MLKVLFNVVLVFLLSASSLPAIAANLTRAESDTLVQQLSDQHFQSFAGFLSQVSVLNPALSGTISA
ncbi:MAG: hypothetical protein Q8K17_03855, partial [Pseudohongiella sp.]|nr:hypothetical protein [Pseudohongiella sp.]